MTVVRKYPTEYVNEGAWANPQYILGEADNQCATKLTTSTSPLKLYCKTFGFNIPADATIIRVTLGAKAQYPVAYPHSLLLMYFKLGSYLWGWAPSSISSLNCALTFWQTDNIDLGVIPITVADLNNETFQVWLQISSDDGVNSAIAFGDAVYLEVEYTVPALARMVGDGLTWVVG